MGYRIAGNRADRAVDADLVYSIHRDGDDQLQVYRHGNVLGHDPEILLLKSRKTAECYSENHQPSL